MKIRCYNLHDEQEISNDDLLWAYIKTSATSASSKGIGRSPTGIANGSVAFGFFVDGNERNQPLIIGTYNAKGDLSPLVLGQQILKKDLFGPEPSSAYNSKYPHNEVYTTKSGHVVEFDSTPGHERIHVYHKSGTYTEINETGRNVDKTVDDKFEIVVGDKTLYIGKDLDITVLGNVNLKVNGNIKGDVQGNVDLNVDGEASATVQGDVDLTSQGTIKINAPTVRING